MKGKNATLACLIAIIGLSLFLRLYRLSSFSFWHDEAGTANRTSLPLSKIIREPLLRGEKNPPGYYFLIVLWSRVFGNSELSLRLPSAIFSVGTVIAVYFLGKNLFSPRTGLTAAFLLAINPYSINYAQEARMYSLTWCYGILSFLAFHHYLKDRGLLSLAVCSVINLFALYTSYSGAFYPLAQNIIFFGLRRQRKYSAWLISQAVTALLFAPYFFTFALKLIPHGLGDAWRGSVTNYRSLFIGMAAHFSGDLKGVDLGFKFLLWPLFVIFGWFTFRVKRITFDFHQGDCLLAAWFLVPILASLSVNLLLFPFLTCLTIRYIGFIQIPFVIATAKGIAKLPRVFFLLGLFGLTAITSTFYLYPYYVLNLGLTREDWKALVSRLEGEAGAGDLTVTTIGTTEPYLCYRRLPGPAWKYANDPRLMKIDREYRFVFVLYRQWRQQELFKKIPGFDLVGRFSLGNIGYYRFQKTP